MDRKIIEESLQGSNYALGRLISFLDDWEKRKQIMKEIEPHTGKACIIGITGPTGAGKSTLISSLVTHLRNLDLTLGLLCVDPTSPFSGGSILGDRLRMKNHSLDRGVFIRSLASRDWLGGTSPTTREAVKLLDASGRDIVIVESAGAGQAQVDVRNVADTVLVVAVPGLGDSIQMLKAGLMEIADIFVLNMADREGSERMLKELEDAAVRFEGPWQPPVISTVATREEGVDKLYGAILDHRKYLQESGLLLQRRRERNLEHTLELVHDRLKDNLASQLKKQPELVQLVKRLRAGELDPYTASAKILECMLQS